MIDHTQAELEFYDNLDSFKFSFSSLSSLLRRPMDFYNSHVLLKEREDKDYMVFGRLFHAKLLEPHTVSDKFKILNVNLPTGQLKDTVDQMISLHYHSPKGSKLSDYSNEIIQYMKLINYYQNLKDDAGRLAKIITPGAEEYFEAFTKDASKTLVSAETILKADEKVLAISNDETTKRIFNLEREGWESQSEVEIAIEKEMLPKGFNYGLKGILDKVVFNNELKKVIIYDAKLHNSGTIDDFHDKAEYYKYPMQGAIYKLLINSLLTTKDYDISIYFGVVDKNNDAYSFKLSDESLVKAEATLLEALKKDGIADYHFTKKNFRLPYQYLLNNIKL
jgi:hypothetical protein